MKIAAYVMRDYAKQNYAQECHNVRAWPGFEMVLDSIRRAGYEVEYAGIDTINQYDVVLVSITSDCDWWPFMRERLKWPKGSYLVVAGGAGVLNVRPFLQLVNVFMIGRGEFILPAMLAAHEKGDRYNSDSMIWSESFAIENKYKIAQTRQVYPHQFTLTNGKTFQEHSIGCPNKCLFCGYTWHRKYIGDGTFTAGADSMASGNREHTIIDLLKLPPSEWQKTGPLRMVGLDGMSERLRLAVNKPITREMLRSFFRGLASIMPPHQVKMYCIVGYPEETESDWHEFLDDLNIVDKELSPTKKQWSLLVHFTPFRAMPATPAACWPMSDYNYRGKVSRCLKRLNMPGNVFFQGNLFWAVEGMGTEGLSTVIESAACLRGTEQDADPMMKIAVASNYWNAPMRDKIATLRKVLDVPRLFARYTWQTLPTRYLRPNTDIERR